MRFFLLRALNVRYKQVYQQHFISLMSQNWSFHWLTFWILCCVYMWHGVPAWYIFPSSGPIRSRMHTWVPKGMCECVTSLPRGMPLPRAQVRPMTLATNVLKVRYSLSTTPLRMVFISGIPEPAGEISWLLSKPNLSAHFSGMIAVSQVVQRLSRGWLFDPQSLRPTCQSVPEC